MISTLTETKRCKRFDWRIERCFVKGVASVVIHADSLLAAETAIAQDVEGKHENGE